MKTRFMWGCAAMSVAIFACWHFRETRLHRDNAGWQTLEQARRPFKTGLMVEGNPPSIEIELIEPHDSNPIVVNANTMYKVLVKTKLLGSDAKNPQLAPTIVSLEILNKPRVLQSVLLSPEARADDGFVFSGAVRSPEMAGIYDLLITSRYLVKPPTVPRDAKANTPTVKFHVSLAQGKESVSSTSPTQDFSSTSLRRRMDVRK